MLLIGAAFVFADDFEEFSFKIMKAFPGVEYVSQEIWEKWEGNSEAFINYYIENGQCYGE